MPGAWPTVEPSDGAGVSCAFGLLEGAPPGMPGLVRLGLPGIVEAEPGREPGAVAAPPGLVLRPPGEPALPGLPALPALPAPPDPPPAPPPPPPPPPPPWARATLPE